MTAQFSGLYVILDAQAYGEALLPTAKVLLDAGVRLFQYRAKTGIQLEIVEQLMHLAAHYQALIIVNDDLKAASYAHGLHVGQDDLAGRNIPNLRAALPGKYIGISCHTIDQSVAAQGADYIGVGPYANTASKQLEREPLGLTGIGNIVESVDIPVCAIGGIRAGDARLLRGKGVAMIAVIEGIAKAVDPASAAQEYISAFRAQP